MFDLENTKRLPYFHCLWAKLEGGSKTGYLRLVAKMLTDRLTMALWGTGGQGGIGTGQMHFPNLYCVIEARNGKRIWRSVALV